MVELLGECAEHARSLAVIGGGPGVTGGGGVPIHRQTGSGAAMVPASVVHQQQLMAQQSLPSLSGGGGVDGLGVTSTEAVTEAAAATNWGPGAGGGLSASSSRRNSAASLAAAAAAAAGPSSSSPLRTGARAPRGGLLIGRQRPRVSVQGTAACLVCNSDGHDSCGFCPMSSALKGLLRIMAPDPPIQARFVAAGGVALLFELMMPEVGRPQSRLMQSLAALLAVALTGNFTEAQDEVRAAGGIEVLVAALSGMTHERPAGRGGHAGAEGFTGFDIYQLRFSILNALTLAVAGNRANKVVFREQAGFVPLISLLRQLRAARGAGPRPIEDGEHLEAASLQLLAATLPDSPANQDAASKMGAAPILLALLCGPGAFQESPQLRLLAADCLGLMAEQQPAVAEEAVAAGAVHALMARLAQGVDEGEEQVRFGFSMMRC